jgi:deoxyribose-phosphate aldolase
MLGGADFIKTSTGKISIGATQDSVRLMLESIKYFYILTGKKIGIKPSGGIKYYKDGISYLRMVKAILGDKWINPDLFRIGASSMIDDIERKYNEIKK